MFRSCNGRPLPLPPTTPPASPTTSPEASAQPPAGTTEAVDGRIGRVRSSHRGHISPIVRAIASAHRAVRIAPSPCPAGHRAHSSRTCSIKPWQFAHLPSVISRRIRDSPTARTAAAPSARTTSAPEPTPESRRRTEPPSEAGTEGGSSDRRSHAHGRTLHPCISVRGLPRLRSPYRTVPLAAAGHRPLSLWSCSIKSRHIIHLPCTCDCSGQVPGTQ